MMIIINRLNCWDLDVLKSWKNFIWGPCRVEMGVKPLSRLIRYSESPLSIAHLNWRLANDWSHARTLNQRAASLDSDWLALNSPRFAIFWKKLIFCIFHFLWVFDIISFPIRTEAKSLSGNLFWVSFSVTITKVLSTWAFKLFSALHAADPRVLPNCCDTITVSQTGGPREQWARGRANKLGKGNSDNPCLGERFLSQSGGCVQY